MNRTMGILATGCGTTLDAALESAVAQVKGAVADGWVITAMEFTKDAEIEADVVETGNVMGHPKVVAAVYTTVTVYTKFTVKEHTS